MPRLIDLGDVLAVINASMLNLEYTDENRAMQKAISMLPTVDAEPVRHGRWVNHLSENGATDGTYCSICNYEVDRDARYNYCPHCGARMDESTMGQVKPNEGERREDADS